MASQVHDLIKNNLKIILYHYTVRVMAKERCPVGWGCFVNTSDFENFLRAIQVRRVESDGECSMSSQVMGDNDITKHGSSFSTDARIENKSTYIHHSHRIHLSVQTDFKIRVDYHEQAPSAFRKKGGGFEFITGAAKGAVVGAGIGSVVPVAGTIVGSVLGGIIGARPVKKSGPERKHTCVPMEAVEVFGRFEDYSQSEGMCHCTVVGNTVCPYQDFKAMSGSEKIAHNRTTEFVL